jgi:hypothetical protein
MDKKRAPPNGRAETKPQSVIASKGTPILQSEIKSVNQFSVFFFFFFEKVVDFFKAV